MGINELIVIDFQDFLRVNIELGYEREKAIETTKKDIIESYGLKTPYDNATIKRLNAVALTY